MASIIYRDKLYTDWILGEVQRIVCLKNTQDWSIKTQGTDKSPIDDSETFPKATDINQMIKTISHKNQ